MVIVTFQLFESQLPKIDLITLFKQSRFLDIRLPSHLYYKWHCACLYHQKLSVILKSIWIVIHKFTTQDQWPNNFVDHSKSFLLFVVKLKAEMHYTTFTPYTTLHYWGSRITRLAFWIQQTHVVMCHPVASSMKRTQNLQNF